MSNEWLPIETAPKDGTMIIGICNGWVDESITITWYNKKSYTKKFGTTIIKRTKGWQKGLKKVNPTHWIPLPELPTQ